MSVGSSVRFLWNHKSQKVKSQRLTMHNMPRPMKRPQAAAENYDKSIL